LIAQYGEIVVDAGGKHHEGKPSAPVTGRPNRVRLGEFPFRKDWKQWQQ
jgi:hypothetical protein